MKEPNAVSLTAAHIEDKIRCAAQMRHARTNEYLKDFDKLRSGFITRKLPILSINSLL